MPHLQPRKSLQKARRAGGILLALSVLLLLLARFCPGFGEFYAGQIFPGLSFAFQHLTEQLPFSLSEVCFTALIFALLAWLVYGITTCRKNHALLALFRTLLLLLPAVLLLFCLGIGINYSRDSFTETYNLDIQESSQSELESLCLLLMDQAAMDIPFLEQDENGVSLTTPQMEADCRSAMKKLGETYPTLDRYYGRLKASLYSRALSIGHITGFFSPFTMEAHYNKEIVAFTLPYTFCHELAHTVGYAREEEACFISYLACLGSDEATLRYSGSLVALTYSLNAYYANSTPDAYAALYGHLQEQIKNDFTANRDFWAQYQGKPQTLPSAAMTLI